MKEINLREKLGDWFMDIAKYVATVMILSVSFSSMEQPTFIWVSATVLATALALAFVLYKPRKINKQNKSKRRK